MKNMNEKFHMSLNIKNISLFLAIALIIFLAWYFSSITIYIILALILSLMCAPLKHLFLKIKIKKFGLSNGLATVFALISVILLLSGILYLIIPPVATQINAITDLDQNQLTATMDEPLKNVDSFLKNYNLIPEDENVKNIIVNTTLDYVKKLNISSIFGNVLQGLASLFISIFSILFIAFFVLLDFSKLQNTVIRMVPNSYQQELTNTLLKSKRLLSNYFVGLAVEILLIGLLEFLILSLLKVENALLIGVISGILVIIPYIGPIIACVLGCSLALIGAFVVSPDVNFLSVILKVFFTFIGCRLLDDFFLQPFIASRSVKAHPLEIFLIVLISGMIAGIPGMMLGIPAYTLIRVFAKEFFGNNNFIKTLTAKLDKKE